MTARCDPSAGITRNLVGDPGAAYVLSIIDIRRGDGNQRPPHTGTGTLARECVEGGKYNNVSEVVRASLRLLQDAEDCRRGFRRMLDEAMEEADRDGTFSLESLMAEVDAIIAASEK